MAVALDNLCSLISHNTGSVVGRLPLRGVVTKPVARANPCQFVKLAHSRRGRLVALGECVRAVLSPFHRNGNVPMASSLDLEHSEKQFRRSELEVCLPFATP